MSLKLVSSLSEENSGAIALPVSSLAVVLGSLYCADRSNGVVVATTSTVGTTLTSLWVAQESCTTAATECAFIPVTPNLLWEIDCTSNTATNQLMKRHGMTDKSTLANTASDITTTLGIFEALRIVGAASEKKLLGRFTPNQVTA